MDGEIDDNEATHQSSYSTLQSRGDPREQVDKIYFYTTINIQPSVMEKKLNCLKTHSELSFVKYVVRY